MVRAMVSETTSYSRLQEVVRATRQLVLSDSERQAQCCHQQPESLTACLLLSKPDSFFTEVAESEFRTHPVATAVSATGGVDTTPTCTRADAHVSRAHFTVHNSHSTANFSALGSRHEKEFVSRIRLHSFSSRLTCHC